MLRRTKGGQAKKSQHILGKAADVYFPDVPLKRLRYSGLVREVGGVGYYPTSGTPFVHIDTGRVRHWPRLPRHELALLFPKGVSKHRPPGGRPISRKDVRVAQAKYKRLAGNIAKFHDNRKAGSGRILLASAATKTVQRPVLKKPRRLVRRQLAALSPSLIAPPKLVQRSRVSSPPPRGTQPTKSERNALARLSWTASLAPRPAPPPQPALRARNTPELKPALQLAALPGTASGVTGSNDNRSVDHGRAAPLGDTEPANTWVIAPAFDEEHPEELSYRPFPIAPLLTVSASSDDPALIRLTHPDVARTLELLDGIDSVQAMQFRPGRTVARLLWSRHFTGTAVNLDNLYSRSADQSGNSGLSRRQVATTRGG